MSVHSTRINIIFSIFPSLTVDSCNDFVLKLLSHVSLTKAQFFLQRWQRVIDVVCSRRAFSVILLLVLHETRARYSVRHGTPRKKLARYRQCSQPPNVLASVSFFSHGLVPEMLGLQVRNYGFHKEVHECSGTRIFNTHSIRGFSFTLCNDTLQK
jgi:hypothetical protein